MATEVRDHLARREGLDALEYRRRLHAISEAALAITSLLALDKVLQRIVDTARELVNARYAALGTVDEDRTCLARFLVSGLTPEQIEAIGPWPQGRGLLGALLRDPRPLRVKNIAHAPQSIGFPPNHPPMTSFLGVPIVSRGRILGNFYLANKIGWNEFTAEDEDLLVIFAAHAAVAIENAHLYTETRADLEQKIGEVERLLSTLRESEERFRKVFDEGPLGMAIVGLDYGFVKVNPMLCRMVGYTEEELTALTFPGITHPKDIDRDVKLAQQLFRGEIPYYTMEKRCIRKGGEAIWINLTASIIRDDRGNPSYFLGMIEDITGRKAVESVA